jgi:hypothetical protein
MRGLPTCLLAIVVSVGGSLVCTPPAQAGPIPTIATIAGTGTIAPGLPCTRCQIDFRFTGVTAGGVSGVLTGCTFTGTSTGRDDEIVGEGKGILGGCDISGTDFSYERAVAAVLVFGTVTVFGVCENVSTSALAFIPTSAAPTTTFALTGSIVLTAC